MSNLNELLRDEVIVLASPTKTGSNLTRIEFIARTIAEAPANHVHDDQDEQIQVVEGTISCRVGDEEVELRAGQTMTFPAGLPHAVWSPSPTGSRVIGEFRPVD